MQAEQAAQAAQAKDTPGSTKKSSSKTVTDTVIGEPTPGAAAAPCLSLLPPRPGRRSCP